MLGHVPNPKGASRSVLPVVSILILLGSLGTTIALVYYSLTMESQATVSSPEIILQNGTTGTSTIYTNNTSAKVGVEAPSVYDFVDNNISNVDSNATIGTHSNFTAEKYGPDSVFDNLTEADNGGPINNSENFVDDNISNIDGVNDKGTHNNFTAQQYYDSYFDTLTEENTSSPTTYQIHPTDFADLINNWNNEPNAWDWNNATSATETKGKVTSDIYWHTWNNTGQGTISQVDLRIRLDLTGLTGDFMTISWYVGATQGTGTYEINSTNQGTDIVVTFNDVTEPTNGTWEWADIGNLEIRQVGTKILGGDVVTYAVDEVWGWVSASTPNYELDLEIRWTTADYDETNEYLCINVGTTGDEYLKVDVWTGSWTSLLTDLNASSWNNVSVSSYLTSDTLIVRFLGGTESGDSNQDSWQIECSLLHVWSWEYNYNLDLEIQWTDANYTRTNEELCIKTGTTDTEDIEVYVWNITGSSWHKVFDDLAVNTWNNISVSNYLTESNFTIRFRGGNETGDATQSSWDIDASLLHIWNDIEDYVDNNTSNVDNSDPEDKGTHSNFTTQKYYDSIYDTLTEVDTSTPDTSDNNVDSETITHGSITGISGAQTPDGTTENMTEGTIEKIGNDTSGTGSALTLSFSHTLVSGINRIVIVTIGIENGNTTDVDSVTYGGQTCTKAIDHIGITAGGFRFLVEIWYILDADLPSDGSQTVNVTCSGIIYELEVNAFCSEYAGVMQGAPEATDGYNQTSGSTITNTISPSDNAWVISGVGAGNIGDWTHGEGQVEVLEFDDASSTFAVAELRGASGETSLSSNYTGTINRLCRACASWTEAANYQLDIEHVVNSISEYENAHAHGIFSKRKTMTASMHVCILY